MVRKGIEAGASRRRATAVPQEGRLVLEPTLENSRLFLYLLGSFLHRIEHGRRAAYFGDLDLARIIETIGIAGIEPAMRDADFRNRHRTFASSIGVDEQRGINATSIASATGIPRESVRRKLKRLLQLGAVVEKKRAHYVLRPGMFLDPERQAAFTRGINETVLFMNETLENGAVRWVPTGIGKKKRSG